MNAHDETVKKTSTLSANILSCDEDIDCKPWLPVIYNAVKAFASLSSFH